MKTYRIYLSGGGFVETTATNFATDGNFVLFFGEDKTIIAMYHVEVVNYIIVSPQKTDA